MKVLSVFLLVFIAVGTIAAVVPAEPEFRYEVRIDTEGTTVIATVFRQAMRRTVSQTLGDYDLAKAHADPAYMPKLIRSLYVQGAAEIRFQQALARHREYKVDTAGIDKDIDALAAGSKKLGSCADQVERVIEAAR